MDREYRREKDSEPAKEERRHQSLSKNDRVKGFFEWGGELKHRDSQQ